MRAWHVTAIVCAEELRCCCVNTYHWPGQSYVRSIKIRCVSETDTPAKPKSYCQPQPIFVKFTLPSAHFINGTYGSHILFDNLTLINFALHFAPCSFKKYSHQKGHFTPYSMMSTFSPLFCHILHSPLYCFPSSLVHAKSNVRHQEPYM